MFHRKAEPEKVIRMYKIMWSFVLENQGGDERKRVKHGIKKRKGCEGSGERHKSLEAYLEIKKEPSMTGAV